MFSPAGVDKCFDFRLIKVEKGLVSKIENAVDRRQVDIKITEMGLKLLDEINELADPQNIIIDEEKAKLMNEWLDEMRG